jgi:tRNA pseudouridine38-40 synthase
MHNIKLLIEYDGTDFVGWQIQPNGRSVQGELERALREILQEDVTTFAAGRTDAGVHARGQVGSFKTSKNTPPDQLRRGLNGVLSPEIAVLEATEVPDSFHARYSASGRRYSYHLGLIPTALRRNQCWYVGGYRINEESLHGCSEQLLGEHDFSSFCKVDCNSEHFRCVVRLARWARIGGELVFEIAANRFLYGMVRAIVGTSVDVARGHRSFEQFHEIMEAKDRAQAGASAPAKGLFLEEVTYEDQSKIISLQVPTHGWDIQPLDRADQNGK